jgi:diacylglycerol kinase family enzyme/membrane-associated phospholipid phosphatase
LTPALTRLDRRLYRRLPRRSHRLRQVTVPVSRVTDRAAAWVGLGLALSFVDGRFGRRAATRALLSAGLASALANGPVKRLADRRRPRGAGVAIRLQGMRAPRTTSFPSGHTATAFGFATGAAQELPVLTAPLAALAALVGFSRVHTGLHHPSDVAVGAAVGVGVGLATRRLWPVAPHEPADARACLEPSDVEPSPGGRGLVVVVNSSAGGGGKAAGELHDELPEADVVEVDDVEKLHAALEDAARRAHAVGVAGGDGTVNAAAALAAEHGKPLMVVPGGTLNHFAYAVGVTTIAEAAAAVRDGRAVAVDRAVIDGHTFLNTASIGNYVDLVDARERLESKIGKWPAVVVALWRVLRQADPVDLEIDGDRRRVWMVFIGNCRYHPAGFAPSWRERLDDGQLDIRIVDADRPWSRGRLLLSVLTGRLARCRAYEQRFVREMRVRSAQGPIRLARDGETFDGSEEFSVTKADEPLSVYAPEP